MIQYIDCDGVLVKYENGVYQDWRFPNQQKTLTSRFGENHFFYGDSETNFSLDFAVFPNGKFMLRVQQSLSLLHIEDLMNVHSQDEMFACTFIVLERIENELRKIGVEHNDTHWGYDKSYFLRAVGSELGIQPYSEMNPTELQFGEDY